MTDTPVHPGRRCALPRRKRCGVRDDAEGIIFPRTSLPKPPRPPPRGGFARKVALQIVTGRYIGSGEGGALR